MAQHKQNQRQQRKRKQAIVLPANLNDFQVLKFPEWCVAAGVSERTGRRILASGTGPAVVRLSDNRMGVRVGAHKVWVSSRERT
jgi:hypothetical protein